MSSVASTTVVMISVRFQLAHCKTFLFYVFFIIILLISRTVLHELSKIETSSFGPCRTASIREAKVDEVDVSGFLLVNSMDSMSNQYDLIRNKVS